MITTLKIEGKVLASVNLSFMSNERYDDACIALINEGIKAMLSQHILPYTGHPYVFHLVLTDLDLNKTNVSDI